MMEEINRMDKSFALKKYILITDIGSTTTKALLLRKEGDNYHVIGNEKAFTTVERPFEDVKIGIVNAVKKLQYNLGIDIIYESADDSEFTLLPDFSYFSTSSAGGGLQLLAIGLTREDSVRSCEKAIFGVGGVLLDTLAITDKKSSLNYIQILNNSHPDMILFCGGFDGGAKYSIYKFAEILNVAEVKQKFTQNLSLPLIYAGNQMCRDYVNTVLSKKFELYIKPNLRPSEATENLTPVKELIHYLFLNNVMTKAPGYSQILCKIDSDIIPTPVGFLNTIKIFGKNKNIFAFDIGGATTDVYTCVNTNINRSVSANYGMSYSVCNVVANSNYERDFRPYLDALFKKEISTFFFNYIGNKVLYPVSNPQTEVESYIEHIVAIKAIRMSIIQHLEMYYKREKKMPNLRVCIGAGGVISNASESQAIFIMIESLQISGSTEIWRDRHFNSPHFGVLSEVDEMVAEHLICGECFEKLAVYIKPVKFINKVLINSSVYKINKNDVFYYKNELPSTVFYDSEIFLEPQTVFIIDTRKNNKSIDVLLEKLKPYKDIFIENSSTNTTFFDNQIIFNDSIHNICIKLPFPGKINVSLGEYVTPSTIIGENDYEPPQIYVVLLSKLLNRELCEHDITEGLEIKLNDQIDIGSILYKSKCFISTEDIAYSPVRGTVERIEYATGAIIIKEIQDYSVLPIEVDIGSELFVAPENITGYMQKNIGDFVYKGDLLAKKNIPLNPFAMYSDPVETIINSNKIALSPCSGFIRAINTKTGCITICYDTEKYQTFSQCYGVVNSIHNNCEVNIDVFATKIEGKIGFGKEISGMFLRNITFKNHVNYDDLVLFTDIGIKGLICNTISYRCLSQFIKKDIGVVFTGDEDIPISIIILQGFSDSAHSFDDNLMNKFSDKHIFLRPHTQIRAGAIRPCIFIMNDK